MWNIYITYAYIGDNIGFSITENRTSYSKKDLAGSSLRNVKK